MAQTSAFTYQGKLADNGTSPTAQYDFAFLVCADLTAVPCIGSPVLRNDVQVTAGIFTVSLDFGTSPFTSDTARFLEIFVRPGASTGDYTTLNPRQPITSSPYSVQTIRASSAAVADNSLQLGGVAANQFVQTNDSRLSDARTPLAGSPNYIQSNPATQQTGTNLNIGGNATAGGTLAGNVVDATTQFTIGGNRVLSVAGNQNLFAGSGTGLSNTGTENAFIGSRAGFSNTTGSRNIFAGNNAGFFNTTGSDNSFAGNGAGAGSSAGLTGSANSFFGSVAGFSNTTGGGNSFFGAIAGRNNSTGAGNSFVGESAGSANTNGNFNSFIGRVSGLNNTSGSNNSFVGNGAAFNNTTGSENVIIGNNAGSVNTTGFSNTIIGSSANLQTANLSFATAIGYGAIALSSNSVVLGRNLDTVRIPGNLNVTGSFTGSFTVSAGNITGVLAQSNGGTGLNLPGASGNFLRSNGTNWTSSVLQAADIPTGSTNYIQNMPGIGTQSASFNITGGGTANIFNATTQFNIGGNRILSSPAGDNIFAGRTAGLNNNGGILNSFFGNRSGEANVGGSSNSFFGERSGLNSQGINNSFFGAVAGQSNAAGGNNTIIGTLADVGSPSLNFATAIGAGAVVSSSNTIVLGRGVDAAQIPGTLTISGAANANGGLNIGTTGTPISLSTVTTVSRSGTVPFGFCVSAGFGATAMPEGTLFLIGSQDLFIPPGLTTRAYSMGIGILPNFQICNSTTTDINFSNTWIVRAFIP